MQLSAVTSKSVQPASFEFATVSESKKTAQEVSNLFHSTAKPLLKVSDQEAGMPGHFVHQRHVHVGGGGGAALAGFAAGATLTALAADGDHPVLFWSIVGVISALVITGIVLGAVYGDAGYYVDTYDVYYYDPYYFDVIDVVYYI